MPKIKIAENLTEDQAFALDKSLVLAIGRMNLGTGPLTNLTDERNGPSSETIKAWHASRPRRSDRLLQKNQELRIDCSTLPMSYLNAQGIEP